MTGADFSGVDIDLLADYIGGALTGTPEESAVAARIADDPSWRAAYASLADAMSTVTATLSGLEPEPMPTALADHLDTLLTGLALPVDDAATPTDTADAIADPEPIAPELAQPPAPHLTLVRGGQASSGRRADDIASRDQTTVGDTTGAKRSGAPTADDIASRDQTTVGDASVADLARHRPADGGTLGGDSARDAGGEAGGSDGARGVREREPRRGRRLRWAAPIAVAAGLVAFVGFGLDYLAGRSTDSASTDSAKSGAAAEGRGYANVQAGPRLATGTNYTHATLGREPVQPMTAPLTSSDGPGRKSTPEMAGGVESALRRLTAPSALADCLAAIQQANGGGALSTESIDFARFDGAPAVIVRFTSGNGHWAWASGADCGTPPGDADTLDKVPVG